MVETYLCYHSNPGNHSPHCDYDDSPYSSRPDVGSRGPCGSHIHRTLNGENFGGNHPLLVVKVVYHFAWMMVSRAVCYPHNLLDQIFKIYLFVLG